MPRASQSDVDDAVYLSSSYGLVPDQWQEDVLEGWLGIRPDGKWSASVCGLAVPRQNGKNGIIEVRELFGMVSLGEKFLHTAHEVKTARKAFQRLASFFENDRHYPELAGLVKEIRRTNGQEAIVLDNGGSVEFIARSKGSGRGFTVDVLVLDEAQQLSDDALAALLPTISAAPLGNPQRILTGTPPAPSMNGEVFTRVRRAGIEGTDRRLCWIDYGCEGALPEVGNREQWAQANPALGTRLHAETITDELAMMDDETFARERLGWWGDADASAAAFGSGNWEACEVEQGEPPTDGIALGIAVSFDRSWTSLGAAAVRPDGRMHLGPVDRRHGTAWVAAFVKEIQERRGCLVVIDGRGPAAALVPDLQALDIDITVAATNDVLDSCASLYDRAQDQRLAHMGYPDLDQAVRGAQKRMVGDRWAWGRKTSSFDVSMLEAVTLAAWGCETNQDAEPSAFFI